MDEKEIKFRLEESDADLLGTYAIAVGGHWPATALACAMLDAGLINKTVLLKIVDTLMATASAYAVTMETDVEFPAHCLEHFRLDLEQMELRPGAVLRELEEIEVNAREQAREYGQMLERERRKGPDEGAPSLDGDV